MVVCVFDPSNVKTRLRRHASCFSGIVVWFVPYLSRPCQVTCWVVSRVGFRLTWNSLRSTSTCSCIAAAILTRARASELKFPVGTCPGFPYCFVLSAAQPSGHRSSTSSNDILDDAPADVGARHFFLWSSPLSCNPRLPSGLPMPLLTPLSSVGPLR